MKRGSALLLTILIVGLISIVSLSISRLSITEIKMSRAASESVAAYYAAEAGLEAGLAMWRWNRNIEAEPPNNVDLGDGKSYKLKIWYKAATAGNFDNLDDPNNPTLTKDNAWEFNVDGLSQVKLKYKIEKDYTPSAFPPSNIAHGVEISQYNKVSNTWTTDFKDQTNDNSAESSNGISITTTNTSLIRIKPWDADIKFAIKPTEPLNSNIDSGYHYIESTGYYKGTKRKLVAKIDRKSGTVLAVYDFIIYAGTELKNK